MPNDYVPATDAGLLAWGENASTIISAAPIPLGLSAAIATVLAGKYSTYADCLAASTNPATRGGSTCFAKDTARADLVAYIRLIVRTIQGTPTVTNQQKYDLGITVRDIEPTPIPVPGQPTLTVKSVTANLVRIRIIDQANPTRRGKPLGVDGISVFSFIGDVAPTTDTGWHFQGNTSRTTVDVAFPTTLEPGTKVWITAFYFNPKKESGAAAVAVSANVGGGAAMAV